MTQSPLDADLARLDDALWAAVTTLGDAEGTARIREVGAWAEALRRGELPGGRRAFAERIAALPDDQLEDVARAYALSCHLMNVGEGAARLRNLRARRASARRPGRRARRHPRRRRHRRRRQQHLRARAGDAGHHPPVEARHRRSSLDASGASPACSTSTGRHSVASPSASAPRCWPILATEDSRARRPTPTDGCDNALDMFRRFRCSTSPRASTAP
ncbi:MAG: hypothetical protein R2939_09440 [Kofleriaceae bacterium]